ncbi:MAG: hypothetical protein AAGD96_20015 [Chloroflexota bacterium]
MQKLIGRNHRNKVENLRFVFLLAAILFVFLASACAGDQPSSADADNIEVNVAAHHNSEMELDEVAQDLADELAQVEIEADSVLEETESDELLSVKTITSVTIGSIWGWITWFFGRFWAG